MKNLKKVLALVMAFAMAFTMMASAAFTDQADITCTEAVEMLSALGVINGYEDGSFKPNGTVTRAEMAAMIYIIRNGGNKDASSFAGSKTTFTDVPADAWYAGYVKYCQSVGIISGRSASIFDPNATVTGVEAALMCLRTMGYSAEKSDIGGSTWSITTIGLASENGILDDVTTAMDAACPRQYAAQMMYNMLDADVVKWSNDKEGYENETTTGYKAVTSNGVSGIVSYETNKDVAEKYMKLTKPEGVLESVAKEDGKDTFKVSLAGYGKNFTKVAKDYSALLGQTVKVLIKDNDYSKVYGVYATDDNTVVSALVDNIDDLDDGNNNKIKVDGTEYKTATTKDADLPVYSTNAIDWNNPVDTLGNIPAYYEVTLIDYDDDDKLDYAITTPVAVAQISYLTSTRLTLDMKAGTTVGEVAYDLTDDDITVYEGAEEDDYVIVTDADYTVDDTVVVEKAEVLSGTVDSTKTEAGKVSQVRVDGTWYKIANKDSVGDTIKNDDSYDFALVNGFVFNAEKTKGNVSAENILYVEKRGALKSGIADGVEAKVYFADGTPKTITVTELTIDGDDFDIVNDETDAAADEINATDAIDEIVEGGLFTYSEKDGEYSLEALYDDKAVNGETINNKGSYDAYLTESTHTDANGTTVSGTKIKDGKTSAKTRFADDAVIFVNDKDGVKVVTGKAVSGWKEIDVDSVIGLADETSGAYYIAVGAIEMPDTTAKTDTRVYGFITSDISSRTIDGTKYVQFDLWDGENTIADVIVENPDENPVKFGFVAFDWADVDAKEADGDDFEVKTAANDAVAITMLAGDDIEFSANQDSYDGDGLADEYVVIGVDTKNGAGAAGAKLATAKDCPTDDTKKCANAVYFVVDDGNDKVVECVFVDVAGVMSSTDKSGYEIYR